MSMAWFAEINGFDIVIYFIFLLFLARGLWVGLISQIAFIVAMILGFVLAGNFHPSLYPMVLPLLKNEPAAFWLTYVILFVAIYFSTILLGLGLKKVMHITLLGWFDRTMGGLFGLTKALFISCLLFMMLTTVLGAGNDFLRRSSSYPVLEKASAMVLGLINDRQLRSLFTPRELAITSRAPVAELAGEKKKEMAIAVDAAVEAVIESVVDTRAKQQPVAPESKEETSPAVKLPTAP